MKKLTYLLFLAIGVTSCSVESMDSTENLLTADAVVSTSAFMVTAPTEICAGLPAVFSYAAPLKSNLQVQQMVAGEWVPVYKNNKSNNAVESFTLTFETAGAYSLRYKDEQGFSNAFTVNVVNCSNCDESFGYKLNDDGTYTFTYVPAEDMNNVLAVFTFPQGIVSGELTSWNENGNTRQLTMSFEACKTYEWNVVLDTSCKGVGQKEANLWTDFKVNDNSKKGGLKNIEEICI